MKAGSIFNLLSRQEDIIEVILYIYIDYISDQGQYSLTILENIFCLILQICFYFDTFECNTSDWLTHTV